VRANIFVTRKEQVFQSTQPTFWSPAVPPSTEVNPNFPVPFKVQECTNYLDRNRPNYDAMTKLAIYVEPSSSLKPVGFRAKLELTDEKEGEAREG
jgi:hypothetical protein